MSNLDLWNDVCVTDPDMTKKVNQRGGFTSIDAQYQVKLATEAFGPIGKGWGYENEFTYTDCMVVCLLTFWWVDGGHRNSYGPVPGCSELINGKGKPDTDAHKKAMTDGLTKALSHLGFNADVFMGYFDDNKYVENVRQQISNDKFYEQVLSELGSDAVEEYQRVINDGDVYGFIVLSEKYKKVDDNDHRMDALFNSWPKGKKSSGKKKHADIQDRQYPLIQEVSSRLAGYISNNDEQGIKECWDDFPAAKKFILNHLSNEDQLFLKDRAKNKEEDQK